ncbi:MAG: hypothetical protein P8129_07730 [Anaerolineae bacterium]|jgi:hypothetical protein
MFNGNSRWYVLTLLAICNLVLWVAIAGLVGLLVSDEVDLGLETQLRQVQATAVSAWNHLSEGQPALAGRSTSLVSGLRPVSTRPYAPPASPTAGVAWSEPDLSSIEAMTVGGSATAAPLSAAGISQAAGSARSQAAAEPSATPTTAEPRPQATQAPVTAPGATYTPRPVGQAATGGDQAMASGATQPPLGPTPALLDTPLLLADPEFHNLAGLNAELARSAPGRVVQIRYQEAALNRELGLLCTNNPDLPFRTIQVELKRGQVELSGEISVLGLQVDALVTGNIVARDCRPQIEIKSVAVAGVLTPQLVRDQVEQEVMEAMTWYPSDYPLCLEQIVLEETRATIYGYRP